MTSTDRSTGARVCELPTVWPQLARRFGTISTTESDAPQPQAASNFSPEPLTEESGQQK